MQVKPENLTRKNSIISTEVSRWQNGLFIWRAQVWGSQEKMSFQEILSIWFAKPRKVDVSIMLANLINESNRQPYVARYEIGQHLDNPNFANGIYFRKNQFEFECTSFGLFQPMGWFLVPKYMPKKIENVFSSFTVEKQFDCFEDLYLNCFEQARAYAKKQKKSNDLDFIISSAIAAYAGDVSARDWRITKKFLTWKSIEAKEVFALQRVGFTQAEIDFLFKNDKM